MWSSLLHGVFLLLFASRAALCEGRLISCLTEDKLVKRVERLLAHSGVIATAERIAEGAADERSCLEFTRRHHSTEIRERSLSPWSVSEKPSGLDMFPETYTEAKCLCTGCIINGTQSNDYNSVPVMRSMMFLKKVLCEIQSDSKPKYSLQIEYKTVQVGCTCVVPSTQ
ncbi:interleukin-17C [Astyanax mexicanus]|uniref:Interleukin-17C n=1 Tax=Astyanax mexicanus TaxID=7994 RepID=W5K8A2_ASTMX|nr:interleukin-17C [Astyanax mexicanus]